VGDLAKGLAVSTSAEERNADLTTNLPTTHGIFFGRGLQLLLFLTQGRLEAARKLAINLAWKLTLTRP